MPSTRTRRLHVGTVAFVALAIAAGIVAVACGIDATGTKESAAPQGDTSPPLEAATIPRSDAEVPDAGAGADADADGPTGCPTTTLGPLMVSVPDAGFCIDSTEVTNAQYDAFLVATDGGKVDAGIPAAGLPAQCAAHPGFGRKPFAEPDGGPATLPVSRVTWCDAFAFCAWSGKRLCGKRSGNGDGGSGEYFAACSSFGTRDYPYPGKDPAGGVTAYRAKHCNENLQTGNPGMRVPVSSAPDCEGGIPGVVDMSGNVEEFLDGCDASKCPAAGGGFGSADRDVRCDSLSFVDRDTPDLARGFRCCADER
jgi:formylglycine-generating enzyme required for sulfatase activity